MTEPAAKPLTQREREVIGLVAQGLTNRQIATQMTIAPATVKHYMISIFNKTNLRSRTLVAMNARDLLKGES